MESAKAYLYDLRRDKITRDMEKTWDNEIIHAENRRTDDITAMDIMKTKSMASLAAEEQGVNVAELTREEEWIQLGLDLEQKQWVELQTT